jgi:tetratricopeptide (TPR) repeat protein
LKSQISLLVVLAVSPISLFAQAPPPSFSITNYSPVEQIATDAPPSPLSQLEAIAEPSPCSPESEPIITFKADSNETSSDIPEQYTKARRLIRKGAWRQAQLVLKQGIQKNPDSRHLRMVYADLLWHLSGEGRDQTLLEQASEQAVKAMEIGLDLRMVDQQLVALLSDVLSRTDDLENFERLFSRALALDSSSDTRYRYARGLNQMNSPRTEDAFKAAVALQTEGSAHADYGEWLLDRGRYADVLELLPQKPQLYYLNFLRGVALERSGQPGNASKSYKAFREYSKFFPAPARFRITGSKAQRGIHFDDERGTGTTIGTSKALTDQDGINGLTYMIWGEARGESYGGKLAVGWVARGRVLRGTLQTTNPCPFPDKETFPTLADAYQAVLCQSGAFYGMCDTWCADPSTVCSWDSDSNNAAYDVFTGYKADPVSGHCPGGISASGSLCAAPFETCNGYYWSYRYASPLFQLSVPSTTGCSVQQSCAPTVYGKVCGNGGSDHCFSGNNNCIGPGMINSYATLSVQGLAAVTTPYYASSGFTHQAHLEAPEGTNFNEYLQYSYTNNGTDWADYYSNPQPGATEDIKVTPTFAAYFRWRIVAYQGTGRFDVCNKRP